MGNVHKPNLEIQGPLTRVTSKDIRIQNNLPYSLMVEYCPENKFIDRIYFKFIDAAGTRVVYQTVLVPRTDEFVQIPNIRSELGGVLTIEEAIGNNIIGSTSYKIEFPNITLGNAPLNIILPSNARMNIGGILADVEKYYGPSAYPTQTKLQFANRDWYDPASDVINYAKGGRNLVHELIHASRKSLLISSKEGAWYEKLEMLEEFFGEGLSDQIQGLYSTHLYNFDYLIGDMSLATENLQSSWGGIGFLEQCRYFLLSAAYWKLNFQYNKQTGRYLGKEFNSIYYSRIASGEQPSREMFVSILSCLIPKIEGTHTRSWIDSKRLFDTNNIIGNKTWLYIQDYEARNEVLGIATIYSYETFPNGSDWHYPASNRFYNKNGSTVFIEINKVTENGIEDLHKLQAPISDFTGGFGYVKLYLHDLENSPVSEELMGNEPFPAYNFHCPWGLYEIVVNGKRQYRFLGDAPSCDLSIVASTDVILEIQTEDKTISLETTRNIVVFDSHKDQIIKIKTSKGSYERIIKSGKNHLFL